MPLPTLPSAIDLSPFCSEIHLHNLSPTAPRTSLPFAKKLPWVCAPCDLYEWSLIIPHEEPASSWRMPVHTLDFILSTINFSGTRFLYYINEKLFYATLSSLLYDRKILAVIWLSRTVIGNGKCRCNSVTLKLRFVVICEIHKISLLLDKN